MFNKENIKIGEVNNSNINQIGHNKNINNGVKTSIILFIIGIGIALFVILYMLGFIDENLLQKIKPLYEFFIK